MSSSVLAFHGKNVPAITILSYLSRIHEYCPTTYEVFLSLLVYFDRMTERVNQLVVKSEEARARVQAEAAVQRHGVSPVARTDADADTVMRDDASDSSDEIDSDLADEDDEDDEDEEERHEVAGAPIPREPGESSVSGTINIDRGEPGDLLRRRQLQHPPPDHRRRDMCQQVLLGRVLHQLCATPKPVEPRAPDDTVLSPRPTLPAAALRPGLTCRG